MMNWWTPANGDTSNDHFNMGDWSAFGIAAPGSMMPNRQQSTTLNQVAGFENGVPLLETFGTAGNATFRFNPHSGAFSGGGAGGNGSGGAGAGGSSGGSLQPQAAETLQMGPRTFTASVGGAPSTGYTITGAPAAGVGLAPNAVGTIPVSSGLSSATATGGLALPAGAGGAGAGAGAAAPVITGSGGGGGAAGWFKTLMGNQRMMSGVLTAVGTWYGQYSQKKQAGREYDAMQRELDARRAYEQSRIDAYRNSPAARMAPELMRLAMQIYGSRLNRHGVQVDPNAWIAQIFGAPQGGA